MFQRPADSNAKIGPKDQNLIVQKAAQSSCFFFDKELFLNLTKHYISCYYFASSLKYYLQTWL